MHPAPPVYRLHHVLPAGRKLSCHRCRLGRAEPRHLCAIGHPRRCCFAALHECHLTTWMSGSMSENICVAHPGSERDPVHPRSAAVMPAASPARLNECCRGAVGSAAVETGAHQGGSHLPQLLVAVPKNQEAACFAVAFAVELQEAEQCAHQGGSHSPQLLIAVQPRAARQRVLKLLEQC